MFVGRIPYSVRKHAIKFPSEEFALALGLARPLTGTLCPLSLRDGFLTKQGILPVLVLKNKPVEY